MTDVHTAILEAHAWDGRTVQRGIDIIKFCRGISALVWLVAFQAQMSLCQLLQPSFIDINNCRVLSPRGICRPYIALSEEHSVKRQPRKSRSTVRPFFWIGIFARN